MPDLSLLAVSTRTAALLLAPEGTRYALAAPLAWVLETAGDVVAQGVTAVAPVVLEDLLPTTEYVLRCDLGALVFRTCDCAGLVEAGDYGVSADAMDNTEAFARAVAATPQGGTLRVAPGRYVSKPIFLKAGITFYLPEGVVIAAPGDRDGWPILPAQDDAGRVLGSWEGLPEPSFAGAVTAIDADGLHITGRGVIDAGGDRGDWWTWPKETREGARRPRALYLAHSRGVTLSGITVRNSPSWTVHPMRCDDLSVMAVHIQNPADSPNTDGLDPESCIGVRMIGIHFTVGDDCIAIKAGKRAPGITSHLSPTRDVEIAHCRMERGHGAVVLGSEMSGSITDVTIRACEFLGTDRGLRIKTRRGRGGMVARIHLEDVVMEAVPTPLAINAFYFCDFDGKSDWVQSREPAPVDDTTPVIAEITMTRVTATGVTAAAAAVLGLPESPVTGVTLTDVTVSYDPTATPQVPLMACHVPEVRHGRIWAEFADVTGEIICIDEEEAAAC